MKIFGTATVCCLSTVLTSLRFNTKMCFNADHAYRIMTANLLYTDAAAS